MDPDNRKQVPESMPMHIDSRITHNSQKTETAQVLIKGWMCMWIVGYVHNGIAFNYKNSEILIHLSV